MMVRLMKSAVTNRSLMVVGFALVSLQAQAEDPFIAARAEALALQAKANEDLSGKCFDTVDSMPELKPIQNKIPIKISEATFEQLANQDKASEEEKPVIAMLAKVIKICSDLDFAWQTRIRPSGGTIHVAGRKILEENESSRMSSLIDLYNQKISYGEYIKQRQAANVKYIREMTAANAENDEAKENIKVLEQAQKNRMWSDIFGGMGDSIRKSQPPRAINCNPNGFGGVRCQ